MQNIPSHIDQFGDLIAFEQRPDVRLIVNVPGRYSLSTRRNAMGDRRLFACRVLNISPNAMLLCAPVMGPRGERVITSLPHFGKLTGAIVRVVERGFMMSIVGTEEEHEKLAAKLLWFEQYKNFDVADARKHGRIIPESPNSTLTLADGSTLSCLVIDMSQSGAAVSADIEPAIGTFLSVGSVGGRVVRHFAEGFAIRFNELQTAARLEERVIRP
jgi:hypothetical protein